MALRQGAADIERGPRRRRRLCGAAQPRAAELVGDRDPFVVTNRQLDKGLTRHGVTDTLEVYEGDHGNHVGARFESHVLPFLSRQLASAGR